MLSNFRNRKIIVANQQPKQGAYAVRDTNSGHASPPENLNKSQVQEVNLMLAYEFIETRLDAPTTELNVQKLAWLIAEIEGDL